jgi:hypothetical protein
VGALAWKRVLFLPKPPPAPPSKIKKRLVRSHSENKIMSAPLKIPLTKGKEGETTAVVPPSGVVVKV